MIPCKGKKCVKSVFMIMRISFPLPYHWWETPWGCSPTRSAPARWPDPGQRRRRASPPQARRWTWSTDTHWKSTSREGSSWLWHTCSWFSGGRWAGTFLLVWCLYLWMKCQLYCFICKIQVFEYMVSVFQHFVLINLIFTYINSLWRLWDMRIYTWVSFNGK